MKCRSTSAVFAFVFLAIRAEGTAQGGRIEQARQAEASLAREVTGPASTARLRLGEDTDFGTDLESFGIQQILKAQERLKHFRFAPEVGWFATDNVALTRRDTRNDTYYVGVLPLEFRKLLTASLRLDADVRYAMFRYDRFGVLDFNSLDAGVGLAYRGEKTAGIEFGLRYQFTNLWSEASGDTFFRNHAISLSAQRPFVFSSAHHAVAGLFGQLGFSEPELAERSEVGGFLGYHANLTRSWEVDVLYRYAWYDYTVGRNDHNHSVSVATRYRLTDYLSVFASCYYAWNRSNQESFRYEAGNAGGGVTLSLQF